MSQSKHPTLICRVDQCEEKSARGYVIEIEGRKLDTFVFKIDGEIRGYIDRCPHRGTPLAWRPDDYFDTSGEFVICATHGALFRPADGYCVAGPCAGSSLSPIKLELKDGFIYLANESENN